MPAAFKNAAQRCMDQSRRLIERIFLFGFCSTFAVSSLPRTMQICVNKIIVMARNVTISMARGDLQQSLDLNAPIAMQHKN
jgi:hypothetical protein